jgi:hypothetical protein
MGKHQLIALYEEDLRTIIGLFSLTGIMFTFKHATASQDFGPGCCYFRKVQSALQNRCPRYSVGNMD